MAETTTLPEVENKETPPVETTKTETKAQEHSTKEPIQSPLNRMMDKYRDKQNGEPLKASVEVPVLKEEFIKDLSADELKKFKEMPLDEGMRIKLIETANNMTRFNRLQSERDVRIKELEKQIPTDERTKQQQEFIDGLKTDFKGTMEKYREVFELPDVDSLSQNLMKSSVLENKMSDFQQKTLVPKLEKKYNLGEGNFVYDPNEAYKPNTPSYEYRISTEKQEKIYIAEETESEKRLANATKQVTDERTKQTVELFKELYPEQEVKAEMTEEEKTAIIQANEKNKEEYTAMLSHIDTMFENMKEAKSFTADVNPFAITNIFKGIHFDKLAQKKVDSAVAQVHAEYKAKGFFLPDNGKAPVTDFTKINGKAPISNNFTEEQLKRSPLMRSVNRSLNKQ